jgi:hypothetical protein
MKITLKEQINKINKMISNTNHPAVERNWRRKLDDSPLLKENINKNVKDTADEMQECQENNVGNFTPEDEKQFGILFNSIDVIGTNEKAVYGVISKDNYNYFDEALRKKFDERIKCIYGDKFYGIVDFIMQDFSGKEKEKVQNMLNTSRRPTKR